MEDSTPMTDIPWHLGIHTPAMGEDSTAAGLMFEHTRLTIRAIAFLCQMYWSNQSGKEPMGFKRIPGEDPLSSVVIADLISDLNNQADDWESRIKQISLDLQLAPEDHADKVATNFVNLLKEHIQLVADFAKGTLSNDGRKAGRAASELYGDNLYEIVATFNAITNAREDDKSFEYLWKEHLRCTTAYLDEGYKEKYAEFDAEASECLRLSVRIGIALDEAMRLRWIYSTDPVSSEIASKEEERDVDDDGVDAGESNVLFW